MAIKEMDSETLAARIRSAGEEWLQALAAAVESENLSALHPKDQSLRQRCIDARRLLELAEQRYEDTFAECVNSFASETTHGIWCGQRRPVLES